MDTTLPLRGATPVDFDPFAGPALAAAAPSTEPQREIWSACQLCPEASLAFNESSVLSLEGALDRAALEGAIGDLVTRHEALRTTFSPDGLTLLAAAPGPVDVPFVDLAAHEAPAREARWQALLGRAVEEPFSLETGPLARFALVRLGPASHRLLFTAHHIVCDGWSTGVLLNDLGDLYSRRLGRQVELAPPQPFSAYARAEAAAMGSPDLAADTAYWLRQFSGPIPILDLPTDRSRPPVKTYASQREDHVLEADLVAAVKKAAARARVSAFVFLLGGFKGLLHRLTGQDDLVVGIPAAGQAQEGWTGVVGHCVNTLPLRSRFSPDAPFDAFLRQVGTTLFDAMEHQRLSYGALLQQLPIDRDPGRLPLVSVMFNVEQGLGPGSLPFPHLDARARANARRYETFDLFLNCVELEGRWIVEVQYNADLLDAATVRRWMAGYEALLRAVVAEPAMPLSALPVVTPEDHERLEAWNEATRRPPPDERTVAALVERQVARTPDAVAVVRGDREITYADLDARADALARSLVARGVGRGVLVGLAVERSIEMVVGLLAILKAGGAYVPLDPAYPSERLAFMIRDSQMTVLVADATSAVRLGPAVGGAAVVRVDGTPDSAGDAAVPSAAATGPDDPAYVIYTSGSTGQPKGVLVPNRAVVNLLASVAETPGMSASDTVLAVTTLSFDIAVSEVVLPLTVGARIVIASQEEASDGARLLALLRSSRATFLDATPATWRLLLAAGWPGTKGLKAICTGEAMPVDLARALVERCGSVWNGYGPTETTVWSTFHEVKAPVRRILIGRPVANTRAYVLDAALRPVPIGVRGELWIGGAGVTLGYLNRPELTKERFVDDPFAPGGRMYRTGDIARFLPDGTLDCLGRNDDQVKIRGFRIELGEIEAVLSRHAGVAQAVVAAREVLPGDLRLCAYVVPKGERVAESELSDHARISLPEHMVPQHFVALRSVPLTPSGKVDRKALPSPTVTQAAAEEYVEPRTPSERVVAAVWGQTLGVARPSVHDNFFRLGGHSLLAAQLAARLGRQDGRLVPMRAVFEHPTIADLAKWLDATGTAGTAAAAGIIPRRPDRSSAPLSVMQQRLWFLEQLDPGTTTYNVPSAHRLFGPIDLPAFRRAFREILRRQEAPRSVIRVDGDTPVQVVRPLAHDEILPLEDLSGLPEPAREPALRAWLDATIATPFDLQAGPLYRARLFRLDEQHHVFFFMAHHIVWDGWSFDLLYREMAALYDAYTRGEASPLPELPISYGDFAAWHREWLAGAELERQVAFWKERLSGGLDPLDLPADRPRPPVQSERGRTEWVTLSQERIEALEAVGQASDATLFMTLFAAFAVLVHRYTGRRDLVIGTPVRGRPRPELEEIMGFFVNALPLRLTLDPEESFTAFLARTRALLLDAFGHQDVPLEHLVRELHVPRDLSRSPVYQTFFSYQDVRNRPTSWGGLRHGRLPVFAPRAAQDLSLWFVRLTSALMGGIVYAEDLFDTETAQRFGAQYATLVDSICADPSARVGDLAVLTAAERERLESWNRTEADYPRDRCVHQLIAAQAARTPDRLAVEARDGRLTYAQLDARANRLARHLRALGVGRGARVGICLERTADMLVALQGVLRAGACYVPLDPAFPAGRVAFMAQDAGLSMVVTASGVAPESLGPFPAVRLDADREAIEARSAESLPAGPADATADDPAYVLYTSGSTGQPKGVQIGHRALTNFLTSMARRPGMTEEDRVVALTTLSFDIAGLELHLPLTVGAAVVLVDRETAGEGAALRDLLARARPTVMQATPAAWRLLLEAGWTGDPGLRALCGGEAAPPEVLRALLDRTGEVWNMYGPTETTIWSACHRVEKPLGEVRIGTPIDNTQVWVLDARGRLAPIGVPGEIHIGGDGVADGYLGRPELTAGRFVPDPFSARPGARMYRTGDLGRWRSDGTLECLGRLDDQVKVRGFRIELGEIEAALAAQPGVRGAAAAARPGPGGEKRIVAYVVPQDGAETSSGTLRRALRQLLPDYMVPSVFVTLPALPLTPNAKVDRKSLPDPDTMREEAGYAPPRTEPERTLAEAWSEVLGGLRVGRRDNFFDLGGHSLLAATLVHRIEQRQGWRVELKALMMQTLEQIAASAPPLTRPPEAPSVASREAGLLGGLRRALKRD